MRHRLLVLVLVAGLLTNCVPQVQLGATPEPVVRLPGHVLSALAQATKLDDSTATPLLPDQLTLTLTLNRADELGFEQFVEDVQNPKSSVYQRFLTQQQLSDRFGPTQDAYDAVLTYVQSKGLSLVEGSDNRLTLMVSGGRKQVERAFAANIGEYNIAGRQFYANADDPMLPVSIAPYVQSVGGLTNLAQPTTASGSTLRQKVHEFELCAIIGERVGGEVGNTTAFGCFWIAAFLVGFYLVGCGLNPQNWAEISVCDPTLYTGGSSTTPGTLLSKLPLDAPEAAGNAQKVGIVAFDSFNSTDVSDFFALVNGSPSLANQVSEVKVNGGAQLGPDQDEVLLDIETILGFAPPGTPVTVYSAPFAGAGQSFQPILNRMLNDGVTVISNSWTYCEDQTTLADVQSIDAILTSAAASGVSVLNASGDSGTTCLDGRPNTIGVPADSPHATAVGGTKITLTNALTYGGESWWNGVNDTPPTGQGGYGVSRFFPRPAYQDGFTASSMRSIPDVAANADPASGVGICQASNGGCPNGLLYGGTSLAAPTWAGFAVYLNARQGHKLGNLNSVLYPLANTPGFHSPASMGTDFDHVGIGSPNVDLLNLLLKGGSVGPVDATNTRVGAPLSRVLADGTSSSLIGVAVRDGAANPVSGKTVTLAGNGGSHSIITLPAGRSNVSDTGGIVLFQVTDTTIENVTYTATVDGNPLPQTATVTFVGPPAASAGIAAGAPSATADGVANTTVTVTLQDAQGHGAVGKVVNLSQGDGHSIVTGPSPATTGVNGQAVFTVTNKTVETAVYTATDVTDGDLPVPGSASIAWVGGGGTNCNPDLNVPTAHAGFAISSFATGFPSALTGGFHTPCIGAVGLAFDGSGNLFVMSQTDKHLYKFGPAGGVANAVTRVTPSPSPYASFGCPEGIAFSKDYQHLYLASWGCGGPPSSSHIDEISQTDGHVIRTLTAPGSLAGTRPIWLATDPLSGDLFVGESINPDGSNNVIRISDPQGAAISDPQGATTQSIYSSPGLTTDLNFGPDGTLYALTIFCHTPPTNCATFDPSTVVRIAGTDKPNAGQFTVLEQPGPGSATSVLPALNPSDPSMPPYVLVNRASGFITKGDLTQNPVIDTDIATGGSMGWGAKVGPDNCGYFTQSDRILKITNADGTCGLAPPVLKPRITLDPTPLAPNAAQGTTTTFTATLTNVSNPEGTPIFFAANGTNGAAQMVRADASGHATFTYTGQFSGTDVVTASTTVDTTTVTSNISRVTWTAGKHTTSLTLNNSPTSGTVGAGTTLVVTLSDVSANPAARLSGANVTISVGSQNCSATTDGNGVASCSVPGTLAPGSYTLTATYAGDGGHNGSSDSVTFSVLAVAVEPPETATPTTTPTLTPVPGGSTPTPTVTATPGGPTFTPTPVPLPGAAVTCIPRPNDTIQMVQDRPGHYTVTLTAGNIPGSFVNLIRTVRFGTPVNATLDVGAQTGQRAPFNVSPPGGVPTVTFGINRLEPSQPFQVPLVIADNYGDFPTFAGSGTAAVAPSGSDELLMRTGLGTSEDSDVSAVAASVASALANPGNDCVARPNVQVQVTPDRPGRLKVTLTAGNIPQAPGNLMWSIKFGAGANATVDADTHTADPGPFTVTSANGTATFTFFVNRVAAGQAATVPLTITDYYGTFPTVVGGGPSAF